MAFPEQVVTERSLVARPRPGRGPPRRRAAGPWPPRAGVGHRFAAKAEGNRLGVQGCRRVQGALISRSPIMPCSSSSRRIAPLAAAAEQAARDLMFSSSVPSRSRQRRLQVVRQVLQEAILFDSSSVRRLRSQSRRSPSEVARAASLRSAARTRRGRAGESRRRAARSGGR